MWQVYLKNEMFYLLESKIFVYHSLKDSRLNQSMDIVSHLLFVFKYDSEFKKKNLYMYNNEIW